MRSESVDLAIIGGGPAGLSAACEAARRGVKRLVLFEREAQAGGAVRHCGHLGFGMRDFVRLWTGPRYAAALREAADGLDIRLSHAVTALEPGGRLTVSTPDGPLSVEARQVILATGIRETPRSARLTSGGRPFGILTTGALQRFVYLHHRLPCRHPVVVGTELVAFSTLLTLRHLGARPVALLGEAPRLESPALVGLGARLIFGARVLTGATIDAILGDDRVEGVTVTAGGQTETIACDGVVFSGRWVPEATLMRFHPLGVDKATGGPRVDQRLRTGDPALLAAGNVRFSVRSSGPCAIEGRRAGAEAAAHLNRDRGQR